MEGRYSRLQMANKAGAQMHTDTVKVYLSQLSDKSQNPKIYYTYHFGHQKPFI